MSEKMALVTGASSGIGLSAVKTFLEHGWRVLATVRRPEARAALPEDERLEVAVLDLQDESSIRALAARVSRLDVLVNNAGAFLMGPLESSSMKQVRDQFETNFFGPVALTRSLIPQLAASGSGVIVNVSSLSAENGYPFAAAYSASKAALLVLTEALNLELDARGIAVKAVLPGQHATRIFTKIEPTESVPPAYASLLGRFVRLQSGAGGSHPDGAAAVIYRAATDGDRGRVRYFVGPDATAIPLMKRLLGLHGYFRFFRRNVLDGPGPIVRWLTPRLPEPVEVDRALLVRWSELDSDEAAASPRTG